MRSHSSGTVRLLPLSNCNCCCPTAANSAILLYACSTTSSTNHVCYYHLHIKQLRALHVYMYFTTIQFMHIVSKLMDHCCSSAVHVTEVVGLDQRVALVASEMRRWKHVEVEDLQGLGCTWSHDSCSVNLFLANRCPYSFWIRWPVLSCTHKCAAAERGQELVLHLVACHCTWWSHELTVGFYWGIPWLPMKNLQTKQLPWYALSTCISSSASFLLSVDKHRHSRRVPSILVSLDVVEWRDWIIRRLCLLLKPWCFRFMLSSLWSLLKTSTILFPRVIQCCRITTR